MSKERQDSANVDEPPPILRGPPGESYYGPPLEDSARMEDYRANLRMRCIEVAQRDKPGDPVYRTIARAQYYYDWVMNDE
jgi:hypothetical protein